MGKQYQERDWEVVDYQEYLLMENFYARGPAPVLEPGKYFACIGAAQTFGCFCEMPYPALLQERLGFRALNLGRAGAGPRFFLNSPRLLRYVNEARFCIIQIMSGRSEDNTLFQSNGLEWVQRLTDGVYMGAESAYRDLLINRDTAFVRSVVGETRANWIRSFEGLLRAIRPVKVLFWFSQRRPAYIERYTNVQALFGGFPQLVNATMIDHIRPFAEQYVECISSRGMPQELRSRFTGGPAVINYGRTGEEVRTSSQNGYYPSPAMHVDAANMLYEVCLKYAR